MQTMINRFEQVQTLLEDYLSVMPEPTEVQVSQHGVDVNWHGVSPAVGAEVVASFRPEDWVETKMKHTDGWVSLELNGDDFHLGYFKIELTVFW